MRKTWGYSVDAARQTCAQTAAFTHRMVVVVCVVLKNTLLFARFFRAVSNSISTSISYIYSLLIGSFARFPQALQIQLQSIYINKLVIVGGCS